VSARDSHGTISSYRYCRADNGRRCADCRKAKSKWAADYRRRRRKEGRPIRRSQPGAAVQSGD
jgi:hypothetical protein